MNSLPLPNILQRLENEARTMYNLDIDNLYTDLGECYRQGGDTLDDRQKILFLLAFNNYSIQEAANELDYQSKRSVTQECSKKLFIYLRKLLGINDIVWQNVFSSFRQDRGYIIF